MGVYILTGGRHYGEAVEESEDGETTRVMKMFERGAEVESNRPLDQMFPNKFVRKEAVSSSADTKRKKAVDRLIKDGDNDFDDDDRVMLESMPEKRFAKTLKEAGHEEEEKPKEAPKQLAKSQLGEDVSGDYKLPGDTNLRVFKNPANKFQVARKNNPNRPVNDQALEGKDVQAFLDKESKK